MFMELLRTTVSSKGNSCRVNSHCSVKLLSSQFRSERVVLERERSRCKLSLLKHWRHQLAVVATNIEQRVMIWTEYPWNPKFPMPRGDFRTQTGPNLANSGGLLEPFPACNADRDKATLNEVAKLDNRPSVSKAGRQVQVVVSIVPKSKSGRRRHWAQQW